MTLFSCWIVGLPFMFYFGYIQKRGTEGLWEAHFISLTFSTVISAAVTWTCDWQHISNEAVRHKEKVRIFIEEER